MRSHAGNKNLQDVILSSSFSLLLVNLSRNSYHYLPLFHPKAYSSKHIYICPQDQTKHYESWLSLLMFLLIFGIPFYSPFLHRPRMNVPSAISSSPMPPPNTSPLRRLSTTFPGLVLLLPFVYVYVYLPCLLNYEILKVKNYIVSLIFLNWVICSNNFDYKEIISAIGLS